MVANVQIDHLKVSMGIHEQWIHNLGPYSIFPLNKLEHPLGLVPCEVPDLRIVNALFPLTESVC